MKIIHKAVLHIVALTLIIARVQGDTAPNLVAESDLVVVGSTKSRNRRNRQCLI